MEEIISPALSVIVPIDFKENKKMESNGLRKGWSFKFNLLGLKPSQKIGCGEKLLILIHLLKGHSIRTIEDRFQHSKSTISKIITKAIEAVLKCHVILLNQFKEAGCPPYIRNNSRFYPYFKDCIGALDGSHINVSVIENLASTFRNRKGFLSQNVLGVVDFRMVFTFILAGWEGSAHDSRVSADALIKGLRIPAGKYYLGDAGYALKRYCLTPYRGVRYHLKEWRKGNHRPTNKEELFNLRHSSLRNVIERAFGVLKKRFPILRNMQCYKLRKQTDIVYACFILHNFIRIYQSIPDEYDNIDNEDLAEEDSEDEGEDVMEAENDIQQDQLNAFRDVIAQNMWNDYLAEVGRRNGNIADEF